MKQSLVNDLRCLPVAEITLELPDESVITTEAIIADKETDITYYILGNETQKLIEKAKCEKPLIISAVTTRSQNKKEIENRNSHLKRKKPSQIDRNQSEEISEQNNNRAEKDENDGEEKRRQFPYQRYWKTKPFF